MIKLLDTIKKHPLLTSICLPFILYGVVLFVDNFQSKTNIPPGSQTQPFPTTYLVKPSTTRTHSFIRYNHKKSNLMIDKFNNKLPLSSQDQLAKQKIINTIGGTSGTLEKTNEYTIQYIQSADLFFVEVKDINLGTAKKNAGEWFLSRGMSQQAICDLPVVFYLNSATARQLNSLQIIFNPLAEGC